MQSKQIKTTATQQKISPVIDESILVVKRSHLLPREAFQGLRHVDFNHVITTISENKEFLPRSLMETDPTYKQIIPYLIFTHRNRYFLMQRHAQASEQRLRSKYSFGIGGHIRHADMITDSIFDWARREFHEEITYHDTMTITPIGLLNDDSNEVGTVHIGLVLLLTGTSDTINIKSELQSGTLVTLEQAALYRDDMESWSQMVFDFLMQKEKREHNTPLNF